MFRPKRPFYFFAVFLLPFLVILQDPRIKEPVHGFSLTILKPLLLAGSGAGQFFSDASRVMSNFWSAFGDQAVYEQRIGELESEVQRLSELAKENERYKKLLDFRDTLSGRKIAARIIGWDPSPWRKTLILDKGRRQGIQKDMAVLAEDGLVGRIIEAGPFTSRVILLIDADSRVSAMAEESRSQGIIAGNGDSNLSMEYLELESPVQLGEIIFTSGLNGLYPKGIRIGKIMTISRDRTGLHMKARVEPFVRFSKLEEVICLASSPEK